MEQILLQCYKTILQYYHRLYAETTGIVFSASVCYDNGLNIYRTQSKAIRKSFWSRIQYVYVGDAIYVTLLLKEKQSYNKWQLCFLIYVEKPSISLFNCFEHHEKTGVLHDLVNLVVWNHYHNHSNKFFRRKGRKMCKWNLSAFEGKDQMDVT